MMQLILEVTDLYKYYRLGTQRIDVLKELSLHLAPSEMAVIMGPSGSGKTTLLNCISGISTPDGGTVQLDGRTIDYRSESTRTELRRHQVGMVFQFFNLIPTLTVRENIALPFLIARTTGNEFEARVDALLDTVGMTRRQDHLPSQLSGGEMQLTSIARALVHSPKVLLADEPTGNVNPKVGRSIMNILRSTARQTHTGVLMVTHSPEHAAWADRICFLKDGRIADELLHRGNVEDPSAIHRCLLELGI
jgi:putative ABC transport system ATP-binding protein